MIHRSRLKKVHRRLTSRGPCPECGFDPTLPAEIVFTDEADEEPSDPCPACGQREFVVLTFGDEDQPNERRSLG
jgi:predicted RNA-binding Zn-ribbon protein involved in translation (DUF1610 family)